MRILVFTTLARLDLYASLVLDLPALLPGHVIDSGVNTVYATLGNGATRELDANTEASIKHLELLRFTSVTRRAVFTDSTTGEAIETIKTSLIDAFERRLLHWTQDISMLLAKITRQEKNSMLVSLHTGVHHIQEPTCPFPLGTIVDKPLTRCSVGRDLEIACNFTQLILYRPFLPYLRNMAEGRSIPISQSRHALACIKLASTTISRLEASALAMPDVPLSWSTTYTLFLAIMCLVFLISAHNGTAHPSEAWHRCETGIRLLTQNSCIDNCAATCLKMLKEVVRQLNHTVDFDFDHIQVTSDTICATPSSNEELTLPHFEALDAWPGMAERTRPPPMDHPRNPGVSQSSPLPIEQSMDADAMLAHAEDLAIGIDLAAILSHGYNNAYLDSGGGSFES